MNYFTGRFDESPFLRFWHLTEFGEANEIPNKDGMF
jgi:hypothetical protein